MFRSGDGIAVVCDVNAVQVQEKSQCKKCDFVATPKYPIRLSIGIDEGRPNGKTSNARWCPGQKRRKSD
jgi:hypothetical protein